MAHDVSAELMTGMRFCVRTGSGHEVEIDASTDVGGVNAGPRPMELLLAALAGCGAMDVISILRKMRQQVTSYRVEAHGEQAVEHPRTYVQIDLVHNIAGDGIVERDARRAILLSMSRYCPVFATIAPSAPIAVRYKIADRAGRPSVEGEVRLDDTGPEPPTRPG
jgi:putative redox protein